MRKDVVKLLEFTRQWLPNQIELEDCPCNGNYNHSDHQCTRCEKKPECRWLFDHGEYVELCKKPLPELMASLDLALWLIDAHKPHGSHKYRCSCELCSWRKQTENLLAANNFADSPDLNI